MLLVSRHCRGVHKNTFGGCCVTASHTVPHYTHTPFAFPRVVRAGLIKAEVSIAVTFCSISHSSLAQLQKKRIGNCFPDQLHTGAEPLYNIRRKQQAAEESAGPPEKDNTPELLQFVLLSLSGAQHVRLCQCFRKSA